LKLDCEGTNQTKDLRNVLKEHGVRGTALDFIMHQVSLARKSKFGRRWSSKLRKLALSLFHSSPKTYRLLNKVFYLPSISTLKRILKNINIQTGFSSALLEAFKAKVQTMSPTDKLCSLVFDEMIIKEAVSYNLRADQVEGFEDFGFTRSKLIANHASVFMVRGIVGNWKQPFAYFFSSGPLKATLLSDLIKEALNTLFNIGLSVKVLICDQGSNNRAALKLLGITPDRPIISCTMAIQST